MTQPTPYQEDVAEPLEMANQANWLNILYDVHTRLSIDLIEDRELTEEDKDKVCNLLIQRMVAAVKAGELSEADVPYVSSFISSQLASCTVEASLKDALYLLGERWPTFANIATILYETPASTREEIEKLAGKDGA